MDSSGGRQGLGDGEERTVAGEQEQQARSRKEGEQEGTPFSPSGAGHAPRLAVPRAIIGHQAFQATTHRTWEGAEGSVVRQRTADGCPHRHAAGSVPELVPDAQQVQQQHEAQRHAEQPQ
jgi:hypothetical protein